MEIQLKNVGISFCRFVSKEIRCAYFDMRNTLDTFGVLDIWIAWKLKM